MRLAGRSPSAGGCGHVPRRRRVARSVPLKMEPTRGRDLCPLKGKLVALFPDAYPIPEVGKQSRKTLLDVFERYTEGYMTLFDTV